MFRLSGAALYRLLQTYVWRRGTACLVCPPHAGKYASIGCGNGSNFSGIILESESGYGVLVPILIFSKERTTFEVESVYSGIFWVGSLPQESNRKIPFS